MRVAVVHVARPHQRVVRAQEGDQVPQVLVGHVRHLDHPRRQVAAVTGDARADQVGELAVGPRADALLGVSGDVAAGALAELRRQVGHPLASERTGRGVEVAGGAQHLHGLLAAGHALGRHVDVELHLLHRVARNRAEGDVAEHGRDDQHDDSQGDCQPLQGSLHSGPILPQVRRRRHLMRCSEASPNRAQSRRRRAESRKSGRGRRSAGGSTTGAAPSAPDSAVLGPEAAPALPNVDGDAR